MRENLSFIAKMCSAFITCTQAGKLWAEGCFNAVTIPCKILYSLITNFWHMFSDWRGEKMYLSWFLGLSYDIPTTASCQREITGCNLRRISQCK